MEPGVKEHVRAFFNDKATVTTRPTRKGKQVSAFVFATRRAGLAPCYDALCREGPLLSSKAGCLGFQSD